MRCGGWRILPTRRAAFGWLALVSLALYLGIGITSNSAAEAAAPVPLAGTFFISDIVDAYDCHGVACTVIETGTVHYSSGDLVGTSHYTAEFTFMPPGAFSAFTLTYREVFTGSAGECGSGTLAFHGSEVVNPAGHSSFSFTVIGGTGGLANFSGHGTTNYVDLVSGTYSLSGHC